MTQFVIADDEKGWIEWAAECMAHGYSEESLKKIMSERGVPANRTQPILNEIKKLPLYASLDRVMQRYKRSCSVLDNFQKLQEQDPFYHRIERIESPTLHEFFVKYWLGCKPVIITDIAKNWNILDNWTFDRFAKEFGEEEIEIQTKREADAEFEINSAAHKTKVSVKWFIDAINQTEGTNDFYMTANNQVFAKTKFKELLKEVGPLPPYMSTDPNCIGWRHLWMGPSGTVTPLHHDTCALIHLQIQGSKLWRFISPFEYGNVYNHKHVFSPVDIFNVDYDKYPLMKNVQFMDVVVNPGEAIFLPMGWWHGVKSLDKTISMSMTDFACPNNVWTYSEVRKAI
jgi:hypothetical protein